MRLRNCARVCPGPLLSKELTPSEPALDGLGLGGGEAVAWLVTIEAGAWALVLAGR